jgi:hypothetical protein
MSINPNIEVVSPDAHPTQRDETKNIPQHQVIGPIHFCFIVHGHKGRPGDLSYLHQTVRDTARDHHKFDVVDCSGQCVVGATLAANSDGAGEDVTSHSEHDSSPKKIRRRSKRDKLTLKERLQRRKSSKKVDGSEDATQFNVDSESSKDKEVSSHEKSTFIVHNASCNEGKTHDGVIKGGERLVNEMLEVIRHEIETKKQTINNDNQVLESDTIDVTISVVGNSLGGLYGRYAIARLAEIAEESTKNSIVSDVNDTTPNDETDYYTLVDRDMNIRIHFNVFCSTASPHLGCAGHTYFPIPRAAEMGIAHGLGETGRDLFRLNDLLHTMATSPRFLRPLARFRRRIAYANAFGTDFVVPGTTAAFLDKDSESLHYFNEYVEELGDQVLVDSIRKGIDKAETGCPASERGLVVATFHTPRVSVGELKQPSSKRANDLSVMATSLDSLGWKKVFIDIRKEIPLGVSLPALPIRSASEPTLSCPIQQLKTTSRVVESRHLASAIASNPSKSTILSLPVGHNTICAYSRGPVSTAMNTGGRFVMDSLAIELTNEISLWNDLN